MLSAVYVIAMSNLSTEEISEEEEQTLLQLELDCMVLQERPTVASDIMRQLEAMQHQQ